MVLIEFLVGQHVQWIEVIIKEMDVLRHHQNNFVWVDLETVEEVFVEAWVMSMNINCIFLGLFRVIVNKFDHLIAESKHDNNRIGGISVIVCAPVLGDGGVRVPVLVHCDSVHFCVWRRVVMQDKYDHW